VQPHGLPLAFIFSGYKRSCLFPEILCASFLFNEEQNILVHAVTLQSKLDLLSSWFHENVTTDRLRLVGLFKDMTASAGGQRGYAKHIVSCAMVMGRDSAVEMVRLWSSSPMAKTYFKLGWTKLKDDIPRQVRGGINVHSFTIGAVLKSSDHRNSINIRCRS
jgi:hypothetical protein